MKIESHLLSKGYNPEWSEGSVKSPIFMSSTFVFRNAQEGKRFFEIPYGSLFRFKNGKVFKKIAVRVKRYECMEVQTGKMYLFNPNAEVELLPS